MLEWNKVGHANQEWRLITCILLHTGVIHLLTNMLSLVFIEIRLEQQFGFIRVGCWEYISIVRTWWEHTIQRNISFGSSGALFGLLGAMLSELLTNWTIYTNKVAALITLLVIIAINLAVGILPHIDNFAHIEGLWTGLLLGFVLLLRPQFVCAGRKNLLAGARVISKHKAYQYVLCVIALVLLIVGLTMGLVMLLREENANYHCSWCHYMSCVPTSKWHCGN